MRGIYNPYFDHERDEPQEDASEWKIDEHGRRYRMIGNCKDYAPMIQTTFGTFYADEAAGIQERMQKDYESRRKAEEEARLAAQTNRSCPFKIGHGNTHTECEKACPFYIDDGCAFAKAPTEPTDDTSGKYCPIANRCTERCAMYANGCKLIEFYKNTKG